MTDAGPEPTPIRASARFHVEFNNDDDARKVGELIASGMTFQQAVDQLELRPLVHCAPMWIASWPSP